MLKKIVTTPPDLKTSRNLNLYSADLKSLLKGERYLHSNFMPKKKSATFPSRKLTYCNYTHHVKTSSNGLNKLMREYKILDRECIFYTNDSL